jgi:diguanylate cyclase (GGDEF)-like protein
MAVSLPSTPLVSRVCAIVLGNPAGRLQAVLRGLDRNGFQHQRASDASEAIRLAEAARSAILIVSHSDLANAPALGIGLPGRRTIVIAESDTAPFDDGSGVAAVLPISAIEDEEQLAIALYGAAREAGVSRRKETMLRWLERESERDALTGLHNRQAFDDALTAICRSASESGEPVAVLIVDVLGTKMVNEAYGREAGNELIKRAAGGVLRCIRSSDVAARISGDDFGVVLPGASIDVARQIARRILHHLEESNDTEWVGDVPVTLAFGVASGKGCSPDELLAAATARIAPHHHFAFAARTSHASGDGPSVA